MTEVTSRLRVRGAELLYESSSAQSGAMPVSGAAGLGSNAF